jgi:tetratricopeptide (TPR) repeat protein
MVDLKAAYRLLIPQYSEAIRRNPKDADHLEARCRVRARLGSDLQGALADCNEALRLAPDTTSIFNSHGLVQIKLGSFSQAIADYSAFIAKNSGDDLDRADALYGRGVAKIKLGDTAGGNADIAAAKAIKSDFLCFYQCQMTQAWPGLSTVDAFQHPMSRFGTSRTLGNVWR